jgi:AraC-like DNA-binding protein
VPRSNQLQSKTLQVTGSTEHANFRRFRKLLDADLSTQHQVQHYANALGMSEKTLSRVCVAATGVPAKSVINQRLVLEAIGRELGFAEPSNFVKFFRKQAGMPPLAFRRSQIADQHL